MFAIDEKGNSFIWETSKSHKFKKYIAVKNDSFRDIQMGRLNIFSIFILIIIY